MPDPWPVAVSVTGPSFTDGALSIEKIEVVAQIGHVPVEGRAIGDDAERRVVDIELAAGIFDDGTLSGSIMNDVVSFRREAPGF